MIIIIEDVDNNYNGNNGDSINYDNNDNHNYKGIIILILPLIFNVND